MLLIYADEMLNAMFFRRWHVLALRRCICIWI